MRMHKPAGVRKSGNGSELRYNFRGRHFSKYSQLSYEEANFERLAEQRQKLIDFAERGVFDFSTTKPSIGDMEKAIKEAFKNARKRAKRRNDEYGLSRFDENAIVRRSGFECEITGIEFSLDRGDFHKAPYAPSVDRIDSSCGYTKDNTRLICVAANYALNEWGETVFEKVANCYAEKKNADKVGTSST